MDLQFYPTPLELGMRLTSKIKHPQPPILEPSAGNGDLIQACLCNKGKNRSWSGYDESDFHCVELDTNRAATLKGKNLHVVWDDFLTFNPLMPYRTIVMNPPFHDGTKHLLKALNIVSDGGEIACLLNAETIRNPYTNERKILLRTLEDAESYSVEYAQSQFDNTDVEVALVYVKTKPPVIKSATFDHFKKVIVEEHNNIEQNALTNFGEMHLLIDCYKAEVKSALALYDEISNYNLILGCVDGTDKLFEIKINSHGRGHYGIVTALNYKYWFKYLHSKELDRLLTADAQRDYLSKLRQMEQYEFNERNILQLKADLTANLFGSIDAAIMQVWHNFTSRFSLEEYSKNIHYYNGWKTNNAFRCNKKVIIPLYAFSSWNKSLELYRVREQLADIEKAMNYLDCGRLEGDKRSANCPDMYTCLQQAQDMGFTNVVTKHFSVKVYKKGTCHLTFNDLDLLKKFNLYCGKKLNWLPDDYGRKPYEDLSDEERAVADSFEGKDSYQQTFANQQFFLSANKTFLLTAGDKL